MNVEQTYTLRRKRKNAYKKMERISHSELSHMVVTLQL